MGIALSLRASPTTLTGQRLTTSRRGRRASIGAFQIPVTLLPSSLPADYRRNLAVFRWKGVGSPLGRVDRDEGLPDFRSPMQKGLLGEQFSAPE
jgi:hypothetical protein